MSYIDKNSNIVVSARLTDKGRELLASGALTFNTFKLGDLDKTQREWLIKELNKYIHVQMSQLILIELSTKLYEKGYSGTDIIALVENSKLAETDISNEKRYELLICFNRVKSQFRNEKLLMLFILSSICSGNKSVAQHV